MKGLRRNVGWTEFQVAVAAFRVRPPSLPHPACFLKNKKKEKKGKEREFYSLSFESGP